MISPYYFFIPNANIWVLSMVTPFGRESCHFISLCGLFLGPRRFGFCNIAPSSSWAYLGFSLCGISCLWLPWVEISLPFLGIWCLVSSDHGISGQFYNKAYALSPFYSSSCSSFRYLEKLWRLLPHNVYDEELVDHQLDDVNITRYLVVVFHSHTDFFSYCYPVDFGPNGWSDLDLYIFCFHIVFHWSSEINWPWLAYGDSFHRNDLDGSGTQMKVNKCAYHEERKNCSFGNNLE